MARPAGAAVRALSTGKPLRAALALPARDAAEAEAVALGALLGGYTFGRYTGKKQDTELILLGGDTAEAAARAQVLADAMTLVRDLINTGPSDLYPSTFAAEAERVAGAAGLDVEVLDEKALAERGYGGLTGVGQGSVHPPRLVRMEYAPAQADKTVVFVGKGITFDSGGLSLKPPKSMETMKSDMGGAAAIIGAMQAIAALAPDVRVIGYLPMAENMPSGTAQRPSDVLTMYGGKTVEVLNTDAEGRLVLADCLWHAINEGAERVVDLATLTGAVIIALGSTYAGLMSNDDGLAAEIEAAGERSGEIVWRLPLHEEYEALIKGKYGDLDNAPEGRKAGTIVGGTFLSNFVGETPWAHLDIAGSAWELDREYVGKGASGYGVRLLVELAKSHCI
jgi:leucyl aminopeptidase